MSAPQIDLRREAFPLTTTHHDLLRWLVEAGRPGTVLEIGTNRGGSAVALMSLVPDDAHFLLTVDPWGSCPYHGQERSEYNDAVQRMAMCDLAEIAARHGVNWHHLKMSSDELWPVLRELRGVWYAGALRPYQFETIFLDAEHWWPAMQLDLEQGAARLNPRGVIFVDNVNHAQSDGSAGFVELLERWAKEHRFALELRAFDDGDHAARLESRG